MALPIRFQSGTSNNYIATSSDGEIWMTRTIALGGKTRKNICYGNGRFVIIPSWTNIVAYSDDGVTWNTGILPITGNWYNIAYGNGKFVVASTDSSSALWSTDGESWEITDGMLTGSIYTLCFTGD